MVRDFCISGVSAPALKQHHHSLIRLIIAATPADGWASGLDPLSTFVQHSLLWHMQSAVNDVAGALVDSEALRWLEGPVIGMRSNFVLTCAWAAIGREALLRLADEAEAGGDEFTAGVRLASAAFVEGTSSRYKELGRDAADDLAADLLARAARLCAGARGPDDELLLRRTVAMNFEVAARGYLDSSDPRTVETTARIKQLVDPPGVIEPTSLFEDYAPMAWCLISVGGQVFAHHCATHLDQAATTKALMYVVRAAALGLRGMKLLAKEDVRHYATPGILNTFDICNPGYHPPGFDVAEVLQLADLEDYVLHHDYHAHHVPAREGSLFGLDCSSIVPPAGTLLLRFGELAKARAWEEKLLLHHGPGGIFELGLNRTPLSQYTTPNCFIFAGALNTGAAYVLSGLSDLVLRYQSVYFGNTFGGLEDSLVTWWDGMLTAFHWSVTEPVRVSYCNRNVLSNNHKVTLLLAALSADPDGELAAHGRAWMPPTPGELSSTDGAPDKIIGGVQHLCSCVASEAWAYERIGRREAAVEASNVFAQRFPCNHASRAWNSGVEGRCKLEGGNTDAGLATLADGAGRAAQSHYHLVEMLLRRDLLASGATGGLASLGRAVAAMSGDRAELSALLGAGFDAAAAEAAAALK